MTDPAEPATETTGPPQIVISAEQIAGELAVMVANLTVENINLRLQVNALHGLLAAQPASNPANEGA